MMKIKKENTMLFLRFLICILFIGIWAFWLVNLPVKRIEVREQKVEDRKQKIEVKEQATKIKEQKSESQGLTANSQRPNIELPKLANLKSSETKVSEKKQQEKNVTLDTTNLTNSKKKAILNLDLPDVANETRKVLKPPEKKPNDIALRKEIPINKNQKKTIKQAQKTEINEIESESEETWLPKYISEFKEIAKDIELIKNNLDQIVEQIELAGLINNTGEEQAAIIKNKLSNKIEILKKGDEYQGLKLIDIKNDEIVLENQNINKTYIKKLTTNQ